MRNLTPYTKEQSNEILALFKRPDVTIKEKKIYAKSIGRTYSALTAKAKYELGRSKEPNPGKRRYLGKKEQQNKDLKPSNVVVTHINEGGIKASAVIKIGDAEIKILSKSFSINGLKIDC